MDDGIGLAIAIALLRDDLLAAQAAAAGSAIQLPIESMSVELKIVATKSADGKAGFKVPIVSAELGASGGWKQESTQSVTLTFGSPVDLNGNPVKVASSADGLKG